MTIDIPPRHAGLPGWTRWVAALVGDVVTAAVILDPANPIEGLADSKKLSGEEAPGPP